MGRGWYHDEMDRLRRDGLSYKEAMVVLGPVLSDRDDVVVSMRSEGALLREIGGATGLSVERVRQRLWKASKGEV